jgi:Tfp pilus assembly protein PilO
MNRRGPIIAAAVGVIAAVLVAAGLILPKMHEVTSVRDQVTSEQATTATLESQVAQLKALESQASKIRAQLKALQIDVPPNADLPGLIRALNSAADMAAVDLSAITPGTPSAATTNSVSVVPLQVTITGGYFSVEEFLYRIETLDRTAKVSSVSLSPSSGSTSDTSGSPTTAPDITAVIMANFFTTDMQSGPGSTFGSQPASTTTTGSTTTTSGSGSGSSAS